MLLIGTVSSSSDININDQFTSQGANAELTKEFTIPQLLSSVSCSLHKNNTTNFPENYLDYNNVNSQKEVKSTCESPSVAKCSDISEKENVSISATLTKAKLDSDDKNTSPLKPRNFLSMELFQNADASPSKQVNIESPVSVNNMSPQSFKALIL